MIRGNTSDFIGHPLPKDSISAHGASHHTWPAGPPPSKSGAEWHSQVKIFSGAKIFDFRLATVFCLRYRLSKHKMTRYSKHFLGEWPPGSPPPGQHQGINRVLMV